MPLQDTETVVFIEGTKPVHVHIQEDGGEIVLYFSDLSGGGGVLAVEVNQRRSPESIDERDRTKVKRVNDPIEPALIRRLGRNYETYVEYARGVMMWKDEKTIESLTALRRTGKTRRGLSANFVSEIAREYRALVASGERYPVKAIAENHHVVISAASRWLKAARDRGFLAAAESGKAKT